jgi:hypothetical protein
MIGAGIRETGDRERGGRRSDPQPKRRGWFARVLGFVVCVGLGSVATLALERPAFGSTRILRS